MYHSNSVGKVAAKQRMQNASFGRAGKDVTRRVRNSPEGGARPTQPQRGSELSAALAGLPNARTAELIRSWTALNGTAPPSCLSRDLLMRGVADALQRKTFGGLPALARRKLEAHARSMKAADEKSAPVLKLKPGSRLVREWRGKTHTVLVLADGFEHQGKRYTSLSRIAEEITGAHWSGPRFFGLNCEGSDGLRRERSHGSP